MLECRETEARFPSIDDISDSIVRNIGEPRYLEEDVVRKTKGVKTRFLSFRSNETPESDEPIAEDAGVSEVPGNVTPLGRILIVDGAGRGSSFPITTSFTRIGRGDGQEVQLNFGDGSVSREGHATIVHYGEKNGFIIRDGLKVNPVLLNNRTIRGDEKLTSGDLIRVGETTLLFMAF